VFWEKIIAAARISLKLSKAFIKGRKLQQTTMQKTCNNKQSSSRVKNSRKQQKRQQQQTSSAGILDHNNNNNNLMNSSLNTTTSDSSNSPSSNSSSSTERALTPSTIRKPGTTKGTWTREQVNRASLYLSSLNLLAEICLKMKKIYSL
jgi:hypothetical protein